MTRPHFATLPDAERGPYVALTLALWDYADVESSFKGRTPDEEKRLERALDRITLACRAVVRMEDAR